MPHILPAEADAYADKNKLGVSVLDVDLEESQAVQVLARAGQVYDSSTWVDEATTPSLVRKIIAMRYTGYLYLRTYSEDEDGNAYGMFLLQQADLLLSGIVDGSIGLSDVTEPKTNDNSPTFYPTDDSSAQCPTPEDSSLGPAVFSMGKVW